MNPSEVEQTVDVDEKYQIKSEIDHILTRSGMFVGSITTDLINYPLYIPSKNKIIYQQNTGHNAGLLKLVDEILSNSIDEHRDTTALFKVTKIDVEINENGFVKISDNGGIPVKVHKASGLITPELIFGTLRTSANYNDSQSRTKVGTNGYGAKLTNIFSKKFSVYTCDGKNQITIDWSNNMREKIASVITPTTEHGTTIRFEIDLERFELDKLMMSIIRIVQKRCIDAAAANPGLHITFKTDIAEGKLDSEWLFNSFEEYVKLYLTDDQIQQMIVYNTIKKDNIIIIPESLGFDFGFVNGAICSSGTHMKKILSQICDKILDYAAKNDMELLTEKDILSKMSIFVNTNVYNPIYDSQTKEKLSIKLDKHTLQLSTEFLDSLLKSQLMENLITYYEVKFAEEKKKELKKLNSLIKQTKAKKLIKAANDNSDLNELWLFEGDSAGSGFRNARNGYQSAYLLRGKITNTFNLSRNQILDNVELREVVATLKLIFNDPKANLKNCDFSKIIFGTDADHDGNHICGLLICFFAKHFPELFKAGKVYRSLSPIIVANPEPAAKKRGEISYYYYTLESFENRKEPLKGYDIIYTKGLGGLSNDDYKRMIRNQKLIQFEIKDIQDMEAINTWFAKSTDMRKELLLADEGNFTEE